eukprot:6202657-Pleurochrysis_carterae.AAC.2
MESSRCALQRLSATSLALTCRRVVLARCVMRRTIGRRLASGSLGSFYLTFTSTCSGVVCSISV